MYCSISWVKKSVGLRQRHLVVQVLTAASQDKPFSLELGVTDSSGTRRRLVLSSSFRALHCTPLHAQVDLGVLFFTGARSGRDIYNRASARCFLIRELACLFHENIETVPGFVVTVANVYVTTSIGCVLLQATEAALCTGGPP